MTLNTSVNTKPNKTFFINNLCTFLDICNMGENKTNVFKEIKYFLNLLLQNNMYEY